MQIIQQPVFRIPDCTVRLPKVTVLSECVATKYNDGRITGSNAATHLNESEEIKRKWHFRESQTCANENWQDRVWRSGEKFRSRKHWNKSHVSQTKRIHFSPHKWQRSRACITWVMRVICPRFCIGYKIHLACCAPFSHPHSGNIIEYALNANHCACAGVSRVRRAGGRAAVNNFTSAKPPFTG